MESSPTGGSGSAATSPQGRPGILLALVLAAALTTQLPRPLFDPDEGRYVAAALEMVESGDWFTPRLRHDLPHLSKPPLTYWLVAGSMQIFGVSVAAARLPWTLSLLATAFVVAALVRQLIPGRELIAALVYGTMLLPWTAASVVTPDTPLALFEAVATLGLVRWLRSGARQRRWLWLTWAGLGLAALTKGPPGILPLLPIVAYLAVTERGKLLRFFSPLPVLAFLVISTSWYVAQGLARPDVVDYWLSTEVVGRLASSDLERNSDLLGGFRVYIPTLLIGLLPWLAVQRRNDGIEWLPGDRLFVVLWFSVPLLVFFAARSRLPLYVLPLAAPAAIWIASRINPDRVKRPACLALVTLWIILLGTLAVVSGSVRPDRNGRLLAQAITAERGTPEEIVFVNENPAWSLRFYLKRPLQRVNLAGYQDWGDHTYRPVAKSIDELMAERRVRRVFLLPRHHYVAFRNEMRANGREIARLGHYERLVFFEDRPAGSAGDEPARP